MQSKRISILGCGWLGKISASHMMKDGYEVLGSYHSESDKCVLHASGIKPVFVDLKEDGLVCDDSSFWDSEVLVIAIPPKRSDDVQQVYTAYFTHLLALLKQHGPQNVVFISSTSVYAEDGREVREDDSCVPNRLGGKAVLGVEQLLSQADTLDVLILRCGGLIGKDRLPGGFTQKVGFRLRGDVPVNLVFGEDVARAILFLIKGNHWNQTYNVVAPTHPLRSDLYSKAAVLQGLGDMGVSKMEKNKMFKVVSAQKLMNLGFEFKYSDLLRDLKHLYS